MLSCLSKHGFKILDWYENLSKDEIPPEWMWTLDHELDLWFENVEAEREKKYGGNSGEDDLPGGMMRNELADELRGR